MEKCKDYKRCNGCQLQNMNYEEQLKFKERAVIKSVGKYGRVEKIIGMEDPLFYRNKVQAVFRKDRRGKIISGVYQSSNGGIVGVEKCMLNSEKADEIIMSINSLSTKHRVRIYDKRKNEGFLKHVLIRVAKISGEIMVVLVANTIIFPQKNLFIKELLKLHPEITTIVLNENNSEKMMLGEKEKILFGKGYITDELCGKTFKISPRSFYQVNPVQTEKLYEKAIEFADIKDNETVLDLYCGIGTIGIIASDRAKRVVGAESNASAIEDAKFNVKINGAKNAKFFCVDAAQMAEKFSQEGKADVVFVDPPRTGCSARFLHALLKLSPEKIVYVSCNPQTLGRDLYTLTKEKYKVKKIQPIDMFPFTNHVETVVLLTKTLV